VHITKAKPREILYKILKEENKILCITSGHLTARRKGTDAIVNNYS
jgi:hypothetical protein